MISLISLSIPDTIDRQVFDTLLTHLPPENREKITRKVFAQDRLCSLWSDVLARTMLCSILGIRNTALVFSNNEFGKPLLEGHPDCHFNLSHSGDVVLCAFDNRPVGADVEKIRDRGLEIAERFFSKMEYDRLNRKSVIERAEAFVDLWTLKESYIKALGKGLSKSLGSFSIFPDGQQVYVEDDENKNARNEYFFRRYFIKHGYKAAVCSQNDAFPENVVEMRCEDIFQEFLKFT